MRIPFNIRLFFVFLLFSKLAFGQSNQSDSLGKIRYEIFCHGCVGSFGSYYGFTASLVLITNTSMEPRWTRSYGYYIRYRKDSDLSLFNRLANFSAYLINNQIQNSSSACLFMDSSNFTQAVPFESNDTNIYQFRLSFYDFYDSTSVKEIKPLKGYTFPERFIPPSQISTIKFIPPSPKKRIRKKRHQPFQPTNSLKGSGQKNK